jgi:hypothetical protein
VRFLSPPLGSTGASADSAKWLERSLPRTLAERAMGGGLSNSHLSFAVAGAAVLVSALFAGAFTPDLDAQGHTPSGTLRVLIFPL